MQRIRFSLRGLLLGTAAIALGIYAIDAIPAIVWIVLGAFAAYLAFTAIVASAVALACRAVLWFIRWLAESRHI
jgi:hypothetical protein